MPNRLLTLAALMLCLTVLGSVLINIESEPHLTEQRQLDFDQLGDKDHYAWQAVMSLLTQFKKPPKKLTEQELAAQAALQSKQNKQTKISDARLIGIIVDSPVAALLVIPEHQAIEPLQLTIGQSWLNNWQLETIKADSVVWLNIKTNESYTQFLFSGADAATEN